MAKFREHPESLPSNLYLAEQIKRGELDCAQQLNISMYQLMEKAGHAVFECILAQYPECQSIVFLAGRGNNGGDAYVAARQARQSGLDVTLFSFKPNESLTGDAEIARQAYLSNGGSITDLATLPALNEFELVVDGLLGTGFSGELRPDMLTTIEKVNNWQLPVIAIDLPSGLNADTGIVVSRAIEAQHTVTFVGLKVGLYTAQGPDHAGIIHYTGIGIGKVFRQRVKETAHLIQQQVLQKIPARRQYSNKGTYGHVVCIGGDRDMAGAIFMAAKSALRVGAGKVSVLTHSDNVSTVTCLCPELMVTGLKLEDQTFSVFQLEKIKQKLEGASCVVLGPGLGQTQWSEALFEQAMGLLARTAKPVILDADGLNWMARYHQRGTNYKIQNLIITPHPLEAARLLDKAVKEINVDRIVSVKALHQIYAAITVLKGNGTLVADGKRIAINASGHPGMASAGMGDVLAGIIAGILASQTSDAVDLMEYVEIAVFLHGFAAEIAAKHGEIGIIATDVIEQLPLALGCSHSD